MYAMIFRIEFVIYLLIAILDPPSEPTKLRVVDSTKTSITLGWVKPVYDGGSEITSYVVEQRTADETEWVTISSKGEVRTTEFVASHLKPGVYYFFRVSAVNCVGTGRSIEMMQPVQAKDILGLYFLSKTMYKLIQIVLL